MFIFQYLYFSKISPHCHRFLIESGDRTSYNLHKLCDRGTGVIRITACKLVCCFGITLANSTLRSNSK